MRLPRLAPLAMLTAVVLLTACSSDPSSRPARASTTTSAASTTSVASTTSEATTVPAGSSTTTASGGTTPSGPRIVSLTGPPTPVQCNAPTSVELHWEARGAQTVTLRIDSGPVFATYGDGSSDELVPLACDGKSHTYTLTARAADGQTASRALTLTERAL